jgi:hypothetical protein
MVEMILAQTYEICIYFDIHHVCPHIDEELMKDFISDVAISSGRTSSALDNSKFEENAEVVNNKYCNTCSFFKDS